MNEIVKKIKNSHLPFLYTTDIYYDKETDKIIILMVDEAVTTDISNQYEKYFDSIGLTMDKVLIFHSNANLNRKGYYFVDHFFMECKGILKNYEYNFNHLFHFSYRWRRIFHLPHCPSDEKV